MEESFCWPQTVSGIKGCSKTIMYQSRGHNYLQVQIQSNIIKNNHRYYNVILLLL